MCRVALLALVAVLAACGAAPKPQLDRTSAAQLLALAHRIAHEGPCAQAHDVPRLQARAIALIDAHRVPPALQEPLMSGVSALQAPLCLPAGPPTATTTPAVAPAPAHPKPHPKPAHRPHGHGHGHGHGKHR